MDLFIRVKHLRQFLVCLTLFTFGGGLFAQMVPNAPVKNFKLPRFGDDGFTQWVLQGERGIYDSEAQVRVEGMALRVYSGDERMALELSLDSPEATIRLQENRAFSEEPILIEGTNFEISGTGWEWLGDPKEIRVAADSRVAFAQTISGGTGSTSGEIRQTRISSDQLLLRTTPTEYRFEFTGEVSAASSDWWLTSEHLLALADAPQGEANRESAAAGQIDSVRQITATEKVVFRQGDRTVRAKEAEFFTEERRAVLRGTPAIEVPGAYLTGETVESQAGEIVIRGEPDGGRAQMILMDTGGLGLEGAGALSSETIVLADTIRLRELVQVHEFLFEGRVEVLSGNVQLNADNLTVIADRAPMPEAADAAPDAVRLGRVSEMRAMGSVRIERSGQIATSDQVIFQPEKSRAVLSGSPRITNGTAIINGHTMELEPKLAVVRGVVGAPLQVELPVLPDLGFAESSEGVSTPTSETVGNVAPNATFIQSQTLRMEERPEGTRFRFSDSVAVAGNNLVLSCERMDVITVPEHAASAGAAGKLIIERIEAFNDLKIEQAGRVARAGRGTIFPSEGRLVLEENAVVTDARGQVSGHRLTLFQGQRRAIVEGGGPDGERARITLPGFE